jgi:adenine/guanine phosphoribosyltransferase-like PRPP-binding protein
MQWDDPNYSGTRVSFDKATFVQRVHEMFKEDGSKLVRVLKAAATAAAATATAAAAAVAVAATCGLYVFARRPRLPTMQCVVQSTAGMVHPAMGPTNAAVA